MEAKNYDSLIEVFRGVSSGKLSWNKGLIKVCGVDAMLKDETPLSAVNFFLWRRFRMRAG